ncbi:MAG: hypothetical protein OXC07_03240 [Kistimonas sp.]|nr:hypothetical protein [Kistimonas sp.]
MLPVFCLNSTGNSPSAQTTSASPSAARAPGLRWTPADGSQGAVRHSRPQTQASAQAQVSTDVQGPWFEQEMPAPTHHPDPALLEDRLLKKTLQDPVRSLPFYQQEVQHRRQTEDENREYTFAPLLVTLHNMERLTEHMLDDQQFPDPLRLDERHALLALRARIRELILLKAPYKRSVQLALMMSCLQEILTYRHLIGKLCTTRSRLVSQGRLEIFNFASRTPGAGAPHERDTDTISLQEVVSCHWGGLNPEGPDEKKQLFGYWHEGHTELSQWLNNRDLILHPSFEPLDPEDFCRFGHLPIYPLGMMTAYALNADGFMHTPLKFLAHDAGHISSNSTWLHLTGELPLEAPHRRLLFRQLVLDQLPPALHKWQLDRALVLALFYLFHESTLVNARQEMNASGFVPLLNAVNRIRREHRCDYPAPYQDIPDLQAVMACLWVHCLYAQLRHSPVHSSHMFDRLSTHFVQRELPVLLEIWRFFEQNCQALQHHFLSLADVCSCGNGQLEFRYKSGSALARHYASGTLSLLTEYCHHVQSRVDYTDVVFFDVLRTRTVREQAARALGIRFPAATSEALHGTKTA